MTLPNAARGGILPVPVLTTIRNLMPLVLVLLGGCFHPPAAEQAAVAGTMPPGAGRIEVVARGLEWPLYLTQPPGESHRLFVLEQRKGFIRIIKDGKVLDTPFLDISHRVGAEENEQGLLGLAFHPRFQENGLFYVNYTNKQGDTEVVQFQAQSPGSSREQAGQGAGTLNPDVADAGTAKLLLAVDQPFGNHNGGDIVFGPDGYLYIGMGDGGAAADPYGHAQNGQSLLGKILRIDVDHGEPYGIPPDNPFVQNPEIRDEIWALGVRNPWRYSFDRATGDFYMGDVGQDSYEEISYAPHGASGLNFGWNRKEGFHCFRPTVDCEQPGLTDPIHEYGRTWGMSVTGGYVYRGSAIPEFQGLYFFADFVTGRIAALRVEKGKIVDFRQMTELLRDPDGRTLGNISSFGEDSAGELYLLNWAEGVVYRMVAPRAEAADVSDPAPGPDPSGSPTTGPLTP